MSNSRQRTFSRRIQQWAAELCLGSLTFDLRSAHTLFFSMRARSITFFLSLFYAAANPSSPLCSNHLLQSSTRDSLSSNFVSLSLNGAKQQCPLFNRRLRIQRLSLSSFAQYRPLLVQYSPSCLHSTSLLQFRSPLSQHLHNAPLSCFVSVSNSSRSKLFLSPHD